MIAAVLLLIHIILSLLVFLGIQSGLLKVHKYMVFVALFLPFWGVLLVLMLHFHIGFNPESMAEIDVEKLKVESELYKSYSVNDRRVADSTVPLEEALLVNSAAERRAIVMDVLNDNPKEYIEFLQKAGNNEDTEVVHYAVTALVEISKENDRTLQRLEKAYAASPEDLTVLEEYIAFLWHCLSQELLQGQAETMNRLLFAELMQKKIAKDADVSDYEKLILNYIILENFTEAGTALNAMQQLWPEKEEVYLLKIRWLSAQGRGKEIQQVLAEIDEKHIYFSAKAKEVLAFWRK